MRTDRNKKTARPIRSLEEVWKQLQPCVVTVHDQLALAVVKVLSFDLREPSVLCRKCRRSVRLGEV
jgi:hypothetical protein